MYIDLLKLSDRLHSIIHDEGWSRVVQSKARASFPIQNDDIVLLRITKLHHLLGQTVVCKVYIPTLIIDYITVVISYIWVYDSAITIIDTG